MVEVIATHEFEDWFDELDNADMGAVVRVVDLLVERGVALAYPHASQIKGSKYALRELRVQSQGDPIRIIYGFDPKRQALLLLGANKAGDDRFYAEKVPRAERLWEEHVADLKLD